MRLSTGTEAHLTYCTNIHPADGWPAVFSALRRYAPALKTKLAPDRPFGIGLRLSAVDATGLRARNNLDTFKQFLDDEGLYVAVINGFPYGPFHGTPVKASVYAPDWREEARVAYTLDLIHILRTILPEGLDGGVSTAPLSYKSWMATTDAGAWAAMTANVTRIADALARVREESGALIHLDIEPEPDCCIENTAETLEFFGRRLLPDGAPRLSQSLGVGEDRARELLLEHIRICFDCCHFAVEFEHATEAMDRIRAAGIKIGRIQLSSAIDVRLPPHQDLFRTMDRLRTFADTTYLHQVVEKAGGALRHYPDLPDALDATGGVEARHWRIHFHVPLFTSTYEVLGSTQHFVADVLRHALSTRATTHFEIETYTWDVLPPGLKMDLLESIAREYQWVLETCAAAGR